MPQEKLPKEELPAQVSVQQREAEAARREKIKGAAYGRKITAKTGYHSFTLIPSPNLDFDIRRRDYLRECGADLKEGADGVTIVTVKDEDAAFVEEVFQREHYAKENAARYEADPFLTNAEARAEGFRSSATLKVYDKQPVTAEQIDRITKRNEARRIRNQALKDAGFDSVFKPVSV
jgi:hypothetical protein